MSGKKRGKADVIFERIVGVLFVVGIAGWFVF